MASTVTGGLTLDAGALVALDRDDRLQWSRLRAAVAAQRLPVIPAPVLTQVWRSSRQANLARAVKLCRIEATDGYLARRAGELCAVSGTSDAVDAIVVASAARRRDTIITSDPDDIVVLLAHVEGVRFLRT